MVLGINAMVATALLGMGTLFFGDFTKPVRRILSNLFRVVLKSIDREDLLFGSLSSSIIEDQSETINNV